jgi:hypothetical protein
MYWVSTSPLAPSVKPWCAVSGAVFNRAKTEVIPIGTSEYRERVIKSRTLNNLTPPIEAGVRIVVEGQPVRVLGAWIGNGVDQANPWTPTIEKIASSLKRWEASHPTTEGRRLLSQMIIGGMTQYLVKVQGMPTTAMKTLERLVCNFAWSGIGNPPVAMSHLTSATELGGKKVLDVQARNEAIQLTWIQAYLRLGTDRPTWAFLVDEILAGDAPGEPLTLRDNPNARVNQFLQTWHSRKHRSRDGVRGGEPHRHIPDDLREMVKVARKHRVRLEAVHPDREARLELPAIRSALTKREGKPETLSDKQGKCIRDVHGVRDLRDVAAIAMNLPAQHKRTWKCRCPRCTGMRTGSGGRCKRPYKCIERAWELLSTLKEKSLGAEGVLPGRHIVSFLRVFKQFTHLIPSG